MFYTCGPNEAMVVSGKSCDLDLKKNHSMLNIN